MIAPNAFRAIRGAEVGKKEGVHNVHTLGFGSCRTPAGLCRIAYVSAGVQCLQGLEPGSSPTSGTVFSLVRGLGASDCANLLYGPLRGPIFCWWRLVWRLLLLTWTAVLLLTRSWPGALGTA